MRERMQHSESDPIADSAADAPKPAKQPHPTDPRRFADGTQRRDAPGLATKHGGYVRGQRPPELAAVVGDLDGFRAQLETDQGGRDELHTIRAGYVQRLTEVEALCRLLGADLRTRGIF